MQNKRFRRRFIKVEMLGVFGQFQCRLSVKSEILLTDLFQSLLLLQNVNASLARATRFHSLLRSLGLAGSFARLVPSPRSQKKTQDGGSHLGRAGLHIGRAGLLTTRCEKKKKKKAVVNRITSRYTRWLTCRIIKFSLHIRRKTVTFH